MPQNGGGGKRRAAWDLALVVRRQQERDGRRFQVRELRVSQWETVHRNEQHGARLGRIVAGLTLADTRGLWPVHTGATFAVRMQ